MLATTCLGITFENPFILASAPPTARIEAIDSALTLGWGGVVLKTITPDDLEMINASPRFATLKRGNQVIGFENFELLSLEPVKYWIDGIKYLKEKHPTKVIIASIMAPVAKDAWQALVKQLNETAIDAYELNFSCPHGMPEKGIGMAIGTSPELSSTIVSWVKEVANKPVFAKLTPNVTDITAISKAVEKAGADGVTAINTVQALIGVDLDTLTPLPDVRGQTTYGGYSGSAIKPIGLRAVSQIRRASSQLPIMGSGGISTWKDAAEYIALGADLIQLCTEAMLNGYQIIKGLTAGLEDYLKKKGFASLADLKNKAVVKLTAHKDLNKQELYYPAIDDTKCVHCGKCVTICFESGHGALVRDDASGCIRLNSADCVGCSLCKLICPQQAISFGPLPSASVH